MYKLLVVTIRPESWGAMRLLEMLSVTALVS